MKRFSILLFAVALTACAKPNDTATLHDEAVAISTYYKPIVDALGQRGLAIQERGGKLGVALPGGDVASRQLQLAAQQLAELRNLVATGADGKSAIVKQADAAAKENKPAELSKLIDESKEKLEVGSRVIASELNVAENWLLQAEGIKGTAQASATPTPPPTTTDTGAPGAGGTPEAPSAQP